MRVHGNGGYTADAGLGFQGADWALYLGSVNRLLYGGILDYAGAVRL